MGKGEWGEGGTWCREGEVGVGGAAWELTELRRAYWLKRMLISSALRVTRVLRRGYADF